MEWLVIADDLTGACDTGAGFTHSWRKVSVILNFNRGIPEADVLVFNTETRSLTSGSAAAKVSELLKSISPRLDCRVYKKIDSTLRGHPWSELEAVMQALGQTRVLVAPAFPEQGRIVHHGELFVNGLPFPETSFSRESSGLTGLIQNGKFPFWTLSVEDVRHGEDWIEKKLKSFTSGAILADSETNQDLRVLARWFLRSGIHLACGSAGLARALASESAMCRPSGVFHAEKGSVMVVAGSYHPATLRQVSDAAEHGILIVRPGWHDLIDDNERERLITTLSRHLFRNEHFILSASDLPNIPGQELRLASMLAQITGTALRGVLPTGLVLTGGDIAAAVLRELRCDMINLGGEVVPGIPWGSLVGGPAHGINVITKAGGFGRDDAFVKAIDFLTM